MPATRRLFLDWETGAAVSPDQRLSGPVPACGDLSAIIGAAERAGVTSVIVAGVAAPAVVAAWAAEPAPPGWITGPSFVDDRSPSAVWSRDGGRHRVRVSTGHAWAPPDTGPVELAAGMVRAAAMLGDRFGDRVDLIGTPATTGRYLLERTLPDGAEFPVLPTDLAELIRATSGQGRNELTAPAGTELGDVHEVDARLAYGALCRELPAGTPERVTSEPAGAERRPAWWRVSWTVPGDWTHVGLLPAPGDGGRWRWPAAPGETGTGWIGGPELHLARRWGWPVTVHEGIVWPGKGPDPLRRWAEQLAGLVGLAEQAGETVARSALRAILLHTIGALHPGSRDVTYTVPVSAADVVPGDARSVGFTADGAGLVWRERASHAWPEMSHPEWSATVWARARCRLLDAPTGGRGVRAGALRLDRSAVVGFRTDALYLTGDPDWPDDGAPGRYRAAGVTPGPITMPATLPDFDRLRAAGRAPVGIGAARAALAATRG